MKNLNELIALELGWRDLRPAMANVGRGQSTGIPPGELRTYVPNWAGDLNLMWELEETLDDKQKMEYLEQFGIGCWVYIHATAEQKAIAWLKVKGVEV